MKIEEIIAKLKEDGKTDDEIKEVLLAMKEEICAFLGEGKEPEPQPEPEMDEEQKMHDVFGV